MDPDHLRFALRHFTRHVAIGHVRHQGCLALADAEVDGRDRVKSSHKKEEVTQL